MKKAKRRQLTVEQKAARLVKFNATIAARRAAKAAAAALPGADRKAVHDRARNAAIKAFGRAANHPPGRHQRLNGNATPREPDLEGALSCLERAERWMIEARYLGQISEFDPAHREIFEAKGRLLGLSAP